MTETLGAQRLNIFRRLSDEKFYRSLRMTQQLRTERGSLIV